MCDGDGECFFQEEDLSYTEDSKYSNLKNCPCKLLPCSICGNNLPSRLAELKGDKQRRWCVGCDMDLFRTGLNVEQYEQRRGNTDYCQECFKWKQPIGSSRRGGKEHDDWDSRKYHKSCFKKIQIQLENM